MNYNETVERRIPGEGKELDRRRKLWAKIADAYEQGGESGIKSAIFEHSNSVTREFDQLLRQLKARL